jgi:hypothetical protein
VPVDVDVAVLSISHVTRFAPVLIEHNDDNAIHKYDIGCSVCIVYIMSVMR